MSEEKAFLALEQLAALGELADGASPGEWVFECPHDGTASIYNNEGHEVAGNLGDEDALFIAALLNAAPALIAMARRVVEADAVLEVANCTSEPSLRLAVLHHSQRAIAAESRALAAEQELSEAKVRLADVSKREAALHYAIRNTANILDHKMTVGEAHEKALSVAAGLHAERGRALAAEKRVEMREAQLAVAVAALDAIAFDDNGAPEADVRIAFTATQNIREIEAAALNPQRYPINANSEPAYPDCTRCGGTGRAPAVRGSRAVPGETMVCPRCVHRAEAALNPQRGGSDDAR